MHINPIAAVHRAAFCSLLLTAIAATPAAAAVSTWTAAGSTANFSDDDNWDAPPTPDCDLVFPAGTPWASKGSPVNDIVGLEVNAINIYEQYSISGNSVTCKIINDNSAGIANVSLPLKTAGGAALTITVTIGGATLNLSGRISGAGPVTYGGPGIKRLNGTVNNTLSGVSTVALGVLSLDSTASESIAGPLVINSGATANLVSAPEIKDSAVVTVDGTFDLSAATGSDGSNTETIGGLAGVGTVSLGAETLGCAGQASPTVFSGGFLGTGDFRQSGSGVQVFSGTSQPYTGTMRLAGGSIHIRGTQVDAPISVTAGTLVLANDCTVGSVALSGGSSVLSFNETISAMTMHGTTPSLTVGSGSTFEVVAKSPTDYATVSSAAVNISGAALTIDTSTYTPGIGVVLAIITNTGGAPINGTFAGLAEGATVASSTNSGTTFTISYVAGSGNDVTLTGSAVATDTTAPAISAETASSITGNSAAITWTTNEASTSQVQYGLSTVYGSMSTLSSSLVTSHDVALTGLAGSTTYHYRVLSRDAAGNLATSADGTFLTAADITAPVVSTTSAGDVAGDSATVTWTTSEASDSQVEYGVTTAYGSTTTLDTSMVTAHSVDLTGLSPSTTYHYRVLSRDASGNLTTGSDETFATTSGVAASGGSSSGCGGGSAFAFMVMAGGLMLIGRRRI